jgi:tripartite-type tricarboxylate transporter receptor subunit TctC
LATREPAHSPVIKRLHTDLAAILGSPDIQKRFESHGVETVSMTSAEFAEVHPR